MTEPQDKPHIAVTEDGPYELTGSVPVIHYSKQSSDAGEALVWLPGEQEKLRKKAMLCRCGHSNKKPFCDGSHADAGFTGEETAPTDDYDDRAKALGGSALLVRDDRSLCEHAGFCGNESSDIWSMMDNEPDGATEALAAGMVARCPSGALTLQVAGELVEQRLPREVRVVDDGPLWITGGIPVDRADGKPLETRNRMTLCRCGLSESKPLCDGSHASDSQ